jgi:hypothetical protein
VKVALPLALAGLTLSSLAQAETQDTPFKGAGFATCAEFALWNDQGLNQGDVIQWVYGYWSAYNRALTQTGRPMKNVMDSTTDPEPLAAQLLAICKSEPGLLVVFAADRIFDRLPDSTAGAQP